MTPGNEGIQEAQNDHDDTGNIRVDIDVEDLFGQLSNATTEVYVEWESDENYISKLLSN